MESNKKKKAGNGKIAIIIISVFLGLALIGGVLGGLLFRFTSNLFGSSKDEETQKVTADTLTVDELLYQDFMDGEISADEYVKYSMYSGYDKDMLSEKYVSLSAPNHTVDYGKLVERYYDELSDETLEYYCDKVMLEGISFGDDEANEEAKNGISVDDPFTLKAYAAEKPITTLKKVVASPNEKVFVWYTLEGESASSDELAQELAANIEKSIEAYENEFGYEYVFESTVYKKGFKYVDQVEVLAKAGYSSDYLENSMQVYLVEYEADAQASYISVPWCVNSFFKTMLGSDDYGGVVVPYILIRPSSFKDEERLEQLYNHELFHHFQAQVFSNGGERKMGTDDQAEFISEATANWASALVTDKHTVSGFLNENAAVARRNACKIFSDSYVEVAKGWGNIGYTFFVYLYYYAQNVPDGVQKIIDSMYVDNPREYLQNIDIEDAYELHRTLAVKWFSLEFDNMNLVPDPHWFAVGMPLIEENIDLSDEDFYKVKDHKICPAGIEYYRLDTSSDDYGCQAVVTKVEGDFSVYLIGLIDDEIVLLDYFEQDEEISWTVDASIYTLAEEMYIAIANPSLTEESEYHMIITKKDIEETDEDEMWESEEDGGEGDELGLEVDDAGAVGHMSFVENDPMYEGYQKYITTFYYDAEGKICRQVVTHYWETEELAQKWYKINEEEGYLHNHLDGKVNTVEYAHDVVAVQFDGYTVEDLQEWKDNPGTSYGWILYGEYIDFTPAF